MLVRCRSIRQSVRLCTDCLSANQIKEFVAYFSQYTIMKNIRAVVFIRASLHSIRQSCGPDIMKVKATFTRDRICSDPFGIGSTIVWIDSVYTGPVRYGTVPYEITFISGRIWYQIADPIHTRPTRSRVNTTLIRTNFVPVLNGSGLV